MKKPKLISLILAALMLVSIIPMGIFSVSADTPTMPTTLPDDNIFRAKALTDFSDGTTYPQSKDSANGVITNGKWESKSTDGLAYSDNKNGGELVNDNILGASGLMFYLEPTNETTLNKFVFGITTNATRGGVARFAATVNTYSGGKVYPTGVSCTYYTRTTTASGWTTNTQVGGGDYYIGTKGSAWYYIPFTSFIYNESGSGHAKTNDANLWGTNFADFMEKYYSNMDTISQIFIKSKSGESIYFNDVYVVYPELEAASGNAATAPLFTDLKISNPENVDADKAVMENGEVTISGNLGNNTTDTSNKRVWLNGSASTNLSGASGIRFYVDSSSLKEDNAQLLLRIRLKSSTKPTDLTDYQLLTGALNGTDSLTGGSEIQFLTRSAGSTAFVENENGELVVACYGNTANLTESAQFHADTIALPAGYEGYVYIPMDSYYACLGGSTNNQPWVSFDTAAKLGVADAINGIAIVQTYSDDTNAANYEVSYSQFEIVYDDTLEITKSAATLGEDLSLKVLATASNGATVETAEYTVDGGEAKDATVTSTADGYVVVCDGILPQEAGKTVSITVYGKMDGNTISISTQTSITEYCLNLIDDGTASQSAKNLAADLLRYAFAAQKFVADGSVNEEDYVIDTATASKIADLGAKTDFSQLSLTDSSSKSNSSVTGYDMTGAAIRLGNTLAIKLNVTVPDGADAKVTVSVGSTELASENVVDGVAVLEVGAGVFSKEMTVKLIAGDTEVQTLTYKLTDYFANALADDLGELELALVQALYDYGVSVSAYVNAD